MKERERETEWILKLQSYRSPALDAFFNIASMLGEEFFFIVFLPVSVWMLNAHLTIHLCFLLAMSVGFGNILKNIFLIPRPPHPPVWVHTDKEKDHGMPSTHTMTAVSLPWYFLIYYHYLDYVDHSVTPYFATVVVLTIWTSSVMISRVYNGHHTPIDVFVGLGLGVAILSVFTSHLRFLVDDVLRNELPVGLLAVVAASLAVLATHPVPGKIATPAHAETGLVTGTMTGAYMGLWIRMHYPLKAISSILYHAVWTTAPSVLPHTFLSDLPLPLIHILRFIIGGVVVATARAVVKQLGFTATMWFARATGSRARYATKEGYKHSEAEAYVKYATYTAVGLSVTFFVPIVCALVGMNLPVDNLAMPK